MDKIRRSKVIHVSGSYLVKVLILCVLVYWVYLVNQPPSYIRIDVLVDLNETLPL